jgi:hypothetical protein
LALRLQELQLLVLVLLAIQVFTEWFLLAVVAVVALRLVEQGLAQQLQLVVLQLFPILVLLVLLQMLLVTQVAVVRQEQRVAQEFQAGVGQIMVEQAQ